jgi:hypothetical protein
LCIIAETYVAPSHAVGLGTDYTYAYDLAGNRTNVTVITGGSVNSIASYNAAACSNRPDCQD